MSDGCSGLGLPTGRRESLYFCDYFSIFQVIGTVWDVPQPICKPWLASLCCAAVAGGHAQVQVQHTRPLVAPAQGPNAFGPAMAMTPAEGARQGLLSANTANNGAATSSDCSSSNSSSLLFIQQVKSPTTCSNVPYIPQESHLCLRLYIS